MSASSQAATLYISYPDKQLNPLRSLVKPLSIDLDSRVSELKERIFQQEQIPTEDQYLYMGKTKLVDANKTLKAYGVKAGDTFEMLLPLILIKGIKGQPHQFYFYRHETVRELKEKIQDRTGDGVDFQRLIFAGKQLDDEQRLAEIPELGPESTIHVCGRLRGGGQECEDMTFVDMKTPTIIDFAQNQPRWKTVRPGLNLIAQCKTATCAAKNDWVWIQCGFGSWVINELFNTVVCPECKKEPEEIDNCGFYGCTYSYEGQYKDKHGKIQKVSERLLRAPKTRFLTFDKGKKGENIRQWRYLRLTATELPSEGCQIL